MSGTPESPRVIDLDAIARDPFALFHLEQHAWLFEHLLPSEQDEFLAGLREQFHSMIDRGMVRELDEATAVSVMIGLTDYLESWILSVRVASDSEWGRQIAEAEKYLGAEEVGPSLGFDDLSSLVKGRTA